jgi:hypothetical protein
MYWEMNRQFEERSSPSFSFPIPISQFGIQTILIIYNIYPSYKWASCLNLYSTYAKHSIGINYKTQNYPTWCERRDWLQLVGRVSSISQVFYTLSTWVAWWWYWGG